MKIAILGGTGDQGLGIAIRFVQAGENVIIGSRKAEKAEKAVEEIKELLKEKNLDNIEGLSNEDAAKKGDILILTVPITAQKPTLESVKEFVNGKIFVDATVPLQSNLGGTPMTYFIPWEGSAAEETEAILKGNGAKIVSAFNNISSSSLMNFNEKVDCDCLISGDDADSKKIVSELIEKIPGIECIDAGPLEQARTVERITSLLIGLNIRYKTHYGGLRITGLKQK
ncbi:NADPH-dependent F420 reductase [Methanobrevibacter arboriphilus]|uniref:NADPH-dependent F420 reductase n=1 Tax=Methanobrevibacter arboriphilus TaxID=39441 RepID=A0ACA8R6F6_METAZ|nr:NADPH-dependent F420 reductase [Methanobrevibacter arboriphilus]MCC7561516.1 NADPH-dependent F420 reductase [Methanobrevibacter arboriphilus]BBL62468.1 NADPH-dependent F420 reductase [Methanobrevibacter arboriphilus]GLI11610.1 NADPH-dependent F420 reductase [Methanobrevibacter arboriphilus]